MTAEPFVSIVTPVYNGEAFLAQCIDSVLAQDYHNWEYILLNNRSTDRTFEIATAYARSDKRIRVVTADTFVNAEENHNNGFRAISRDSKYCKVVSADDWILPGCVRTMVTFAERYPTVGIVGSYQQSGGEIRWRGLPSHVEFLTGRDAGRMDLLDRIHVFGNPSSTLYRSDLIRATTSFFPHADAHADTSAVYASLRHCDYAFIHEVLSVERIHESQISSKVDRLNPNIIASIDLLVHYGPAFLTQAEFDAELKRRIDRYFRFIGGSVWKMENAAFWKFHRSRMEALGYPLTRRRLALEAMRRAADEIRRPGRAFRTLQAWSTRNPGTPPETKAEPSARAHS